MIVRGHYWQIEPVQQPLDANWLNLVNKCVFYTVDGQDKINTNYQIVIQGKMSRWQVDKEAIGLSNHF